MAKRSKKKPTEEPPIEGDSSTLIPRLEKLEKIISQHFGVGIEELASNESETDNPIVKEHRFDKTVIKEHKDGKLEHLSICPYCGAEVTDLASHKAKCPKRPIW